MAVEKFLQNILKKVFIIEIMIQPGFVYMKILILGANGFIGTQITSTLMKTDHTIIAGIRKTASSPFANMQTLYCDFNKDIDPILWQERLKNIDVVINCVGILQAHKNQSIKAIHEYTPKAIYKACEKVGVKKVIHISALGIELSVDTDYAETKQAAENYLQKSNLNWIILRPSLVYGDGSYGGMSLFRGLAALPKFIPVIADGQQLFQPIHVQDLANAVTKLLENNSANQQILMTVGPEQVSFTQLLVLLRQWLKLGKSKILRIPLKYIRWLAKINDYLGVGPISSTALQMLQVGNIATETETLKFIQAIGFTPRKYSEAMLTTPSYIQDRWHAKLYFLKSSLRVALGLLWLGSGLVSLIPPLTPSYLLLNQIGIGDNLAPFILFSAALLDIALGVATLINWRLRLIGTLQIVVMTIYTVICTVKLPGLWLQAFAPLLKNIPILLATVIMLALTEDR